jgi:DNA-binding PadR family transcriptional regulator
VFYHLILGLLRDGRARHGYDLMREYRAKAGQSVSPGNFYRECSKLLSMGLITPDAKPPEGDPRRIPYRITPGGCRDFDDWLAQARTLESNLSMWLMFADTSTNHNLQRARNRTMGHAPCTRASTGSFQRNHPGGLLGRSRETLRRCWSFDAKKIGRLPP